MKTKAFYFLSIMIILSLLLSSCSTRLATNTPNSPTQTITPSLAPTNTPSPAPTNTPTITPLPPTPTSQPISSENVVNIYEDFQIGIGEIANAVWMPDGNIALIHSEGISIYDSKTYKLLIIKRPQNVKDLLSDTVISHSGLTAASLLDDKELILWDIESGTQIATIETNCSPMIKRGSRSSSRISFNSNDTKLIACDEEGVSVWNISDQNKLLSLKIEDPFTIIVNSDDQYLAVSNYWGTNVWALESGQLIKTLIDKNTNNIEFSHNGSLLAILPYNNSAVIYDISTGEKISLHSGAQIESMAFSPDDTTLALGSTYFVGIKFFDITSRKLNSSIENTSARIIKYSSDGTKILLGWNSLAVFDSNQKKQLANLGNFSTYEELTLDPKGKFIAVGGKSAFVELWDLEKKEPTLDNISAYGPNFIFDPLGNSIITRAWNNNNWWGSIQSWKLQSSVGGNPFSDVIEKVSYSAMPPKFCPSSKCIAVGNNDNQVKIWSTNTHELTSTLSHPGLSDYEFNPDGTIFATSGNKSIKLWDLNDQQTLLELKSTGEITDISFSADGKFIAGGTDNGVYVWETNSGQLVNQFEEIKNVNQVTFNSQDGVLGAIGYDGEKTSLFLLDITNNEIMQTMTSDSPRGDSIFKFSPDGSIAVVYGFDEHLQIWNLNNGKLIKTIDWFQTYKFINPNSLGFTLDGKFLAAVSKNGTIKVLRISP